MVEMLMNNCTTELNTNNVLIKLKHLTKNKGKNHDFYIICKNQKKSR